MFRATDKTVPYSAGAAYERDGRWFVLVTIDNASSVERLATPEEIPAVAKVVAKSEPMHMAKKGK